MSMGEGANGPGKIGQVNINLSEMPDVQHSETCHSTLFEMVYGVKHISPLIAGVEADLAYPMFICTRCKKVVFVVEGVPMVPVKRVERLSGVGVSRNKPD